MWAVLWHKRIKLLECIRKRSGFQGRFGRPHTTNHWTTPSTPASVVLGAGQFRNVYRAY